jgi:hypothetical protein
MAGAPLALAHRMADPERVAEPTGSDRRLVRGVPLLDTVSRRSAAKPRRRLALAAAGALLVAAALWHARPVLVWHITVAPELRVSPRADRLHVPTLEDFPEVPADWGRFELAGFSLRAPIREDRAQACAPCAKTCALELSRGRLTLFDSSLPESYDAALAQFAPSADDVSIFRSSANNWRTIESLASRVSVRNDLPETFRFRAAASQGIVSRFESLGKERFVIYAYTLEGRPARVLALSRTGASRVHQILGGLDAGGTMGPANCSEEES